MDQARVSNVHNVNVSLVARLLQPSDAIVLFPLLEEVGFHSYDPPELNRSAAHEEERDRWGLCTTFLEGHRKCIVVLGEILGNAGGIRKGGRRIFFSLFSPYLLFFSII